MKQDPGSRGSGAPGDTGGGKIVLVVDDESAVRRIAQRILEEGGYAVLEAASGREALAIFAEKGETISLILLDSSMPEMQGSEFIARLRGRGSRVPIVLCSGYAVEDLEAPDAGIAFLPKPFRAKALLSMVRRLAG